MLALVDLSPKSAHMAPHVDFLTSFYCDVTIGSKFAEPFDCDFIIKNNSNRCNVGPFVKGQFSYRKMIQDLENTMIELHKCTYMLE